MLNPITILKKLVTGEQTTTYALARFRIIRRSYSMYRMTKQLFHNKNIVATDRQSLFDDISIDVVINRINKDAVFLGFNLPKIIVEEIQEFAKKTELTQEDGLENFYYSDVVNGYLADGRAIPQAVVTNPLACAAIKQIINDPLLIKIVEKYLGYYPARIKIILRWSFVLDIPDEIRLKLHQTVVHHYDIYAYNFVYANFYLSNTDRYSGAHVMFKTSHNRKTLEMLFSSAKQPDDFLINYYGKENELIIEAEKGYGFIQDASCYHKALPPINNERLMLQIRFS